MPPQGGSWGGEHGGRGWGGGRGGGWGPGGPGGPGGMRDRMSLFHAMFGGGGRGQRRGRGDVRAAILLLLDEQSRNGYQIMQEIEARSEGTWRPSSGSIYPTLQQLEDEGLVGDETTPSGRAYKLTAKGKKHVTDHREELGTPWQAEASEDPRFEAMTIMRELGQALGQVIQFGSPKQLEQARKVMSDARRALYALLADEA